MFEKFKRETSILAMGLSLAGASFGVGGCDEPPPQVPLTPEAATVQRLSKVQDFKNGVWVFPGQDFPQTLSDFKGKHPELEVVTFSQGEDWVYNRDWNNAYAAAGTFVVMTRPASPASREALPPIPRLEK